MPEHLQAPRVDQVQMADLISRRCRITRNTAFTARKTGEPSQLQRFAGVVVQLLDGQMGCCWHDGNYACTLGCHATMRACTDAGSGSVASVLRKASSENISAISDSISRCCCVT